MRHAGKIDYPTTGVLKFKSIWMFFCIQVRVGDGRNDCDRRRMPCVFKAWCSIRVMRKHPASQHADPTDKKHYLPRNRIWIQALLRCREHGTSHLARTRADAPLLWTVPAITCDDNRGCLDVTALSREEQVIRMPFASRRARWIDIPPGKLNICEFANNLYASESFFTRKTGTW